METRINIAEILKDKPRGTKLYSMIHGKCSFEAVTDEIFKINFCNSKFGLAQSGECTLIKFGNMYDGGECIIFPSKEMRDWKKFSWKKGDVLTNSSGFQIFFDKWVNEDYTEFLGKIKLLGDSHCYDTAYYTLASEEKALEFIKSVEEINNGKLNRETLEIEKHIEFKDGDIVCISGMGYLAYGIVKSIDNSSKKLEYYVLNDMSTLKFEDWLSFEDKQIQPITETQQIILFDALARENKAWNAEKKKVVDIKKEHQFKPFEKVLVRDSYDDVWRASFFSHIKENDGRYVTTCITWKFCIPYEGNEHLLGTTKDMEV